MMVNVCIKSVYIESSPNLPSSSRCWRGSNCNIGNSFFSHSVGQNSVVLELRVYGVSICFAFYSFSTYHTHALNFLSSS